VEPAFAVVLVVPLQVLVSFEAKAEAVVAAAIAE